MIGKVPLQLLIILINIRIFKDVESQLNSGGFLNKVHGEILALVERLAGMINGVEPDVRRIFEQLIIDLVHKKDLVDTLIAKNVNSM